MIVVFGYVDGLGLPQFFEVDVDLTRSHNLSATLTDSPIEDGSLVTDHVVIGPWELRYDVLITDTPIKSQTVYPAQSEVPRSQQAMTRLAEIFQAKTLVDVVTPYGIYSSGIITAITLPEDKNHAGGAFPSLTIRQVKLAQSQAVLVQARKTTALKKTLTGTAKVKATLTAVAELKQKVDRWLIDKAEAIQKEQQRAEEVAAATLPEEMEKLSFKYALEDLREQATP